MILLSILVYSGYGIFITSPKYLSGYSVQVNMFVTTVGEIIGYILSTYFATFLRRKNTSLYFCVICMVLSNSLFALNYFKFESKNFMLLVISFLYKCVISFEFSILFIWNNEIFRTHNRGLTAGTLLFAGRFSSTLSSEIATF